MEETMLGKLNPRRSPATLVAVIALIAALGGTAIAAGGLTGTQKKQVRKIATKVFKSNIGGATVAHAGSADSAAKATTATKATEATKATTATTATKATTAIDAEKFGGHTAAEYQRKLKEGCLPPSSIAGLSQEGDVTCTTPVTAIRMTPPAGEDIAQSLGNGLQLLTVCHDGGQVGMHFQNIGSTAATLNWFYGDAEAARASGANVAGGSEASFSFLNPGPKRIEGQFIYSLPSVVMTINLHAFDGTSFCEVRGTVETANG
jgi:hypothetical protein